MKIELVNATEGSLVINSLKLVMPPGHKTTKEDSILQDPDVQELVSIGKLVVLTERSDQREYQTGHEPQVSGKDQKNKDKKNRPGKTTPKKQRDSKDQIRDPKDELKEIPNQMGRKAFIVEHGEVKTKNMSPGFHNTSEPKFIDPKQNDDPGDETDEKDTAFVDMT